MSRIGPPIGMERQIIMAGWKEAIGRHVEWMKASGRSVDTIRLRRTQLERLARAMPAGPWSVTADELVTYLSVHDWRPETLKSTRSAIRVFYTWARKSGRIAVSPAADLPAVRVPRGRARPAPEFVLLAALMVADPRGQLMLRLAAYAGLRRAEIARAHTGDLIDGRLRVNGKGGKVRVVPLHPTLVEEIGRLPFGWLFPGQIDGHLSPGAVGKIGSALLAPGWTLHTLRHRFASKGYAADRDLFAMQELLGHASPVTTLIYTELPVDAQFRAVLAAGPAAA